MAAIYPPRSLLKALNAARVPNSKPDPCPCRPSFLAIRYENGEYPCLCCLVCFLCFLDFLWADQSPCLHCHIPIGLFLPGFARCKVSSSWCSLLGIFAYSNLLSHPLRLDYGDNCLNHGLQLLLELLALFYCKLHRKYLSSWWTWPFHFCRRMENGSVYCIPLSWHKTELRQAHCRLSIFDVSISFAADRNLWSGHHRYRTLRWSKARNWCEHTYWAYMESTDLSPWTRLFVCTANTPSWPGDCRPQHLRSNSQLILKRKNFCCFHVQTYLLQDQCLALRPQRCPWPVPRWYCLKRCP